VRTKRPVQAWHLHVRPDDASVLQNVFVMPVLDNRGEVAQVLHCCWDLSAEETPDSVADPRLVVERSQPALTPREHDVLGLVAAGATNAAIGRRLRISVSTVKYHLANVCEKLGARGRAELIAAAVRYELA
jgi:DNA-binding CsgD family transcriptional regulator